MSATGSCLMIGLKGLVLSKEERDFIVSNHIAGIILFKRNIQSFKQVYELCSELKTLSSPPLLIAVDREGGEVDRFSHLKESPPWPAPKILKTLQEKSIFSIARMMARQLRLLGIDINFAPVIDIPVSENPLLTSRVFGQSKDEILKKAEPFVKGMVKEQLIPCLKHFPGHGGVHEDSHKILPKDFRPLKELVPQLELFQTLFERQACWIMTAHIEFPKIDQGPATFSKFFLKTILREERGFKRILLSDDIDMSALDNFSSGEKFFQAIQGGCDLVISCQKPKSPKEIIEYFHRNPLKQKEIKEELIQAGTNLLKIRKERPKPFSDFKAVKKELSEIQNFETLSSFGIEKI